MHELAKTLLPPPRKQNTACDACRSAVFTCFSPHSPPSLNVQLPGHARSSAIEFPATIKLVVDFCSRSPRPLHAQPPTQVSGRPPARSLLCDSLVNPRSVHQHCLAKEYPCTSVLTSCIPPTKSSHPSPLSGILYSRRRQKSGTENQDHKACQQLGKSESLYL